MHFSYPYSFLLLLLTPLFWSDNILLSFFKKLSRKKFIDTEPVSIKLSSAGLNEIPLSLRARIRSILLSLISSLIWFMFVVSLARPQVANSMKEVQTMARDIAIVLDISGSMEAMDFFKEGERISRLEALKDIVSQFIEDRKADRMSLIVFGANAFTLAPLTGDYLLLKNYTKTLDIGMVDPNATAIGNAIAIGLKRLSTVEDNSKVMILVTDGESNSGVVTPVEAAKVAEKRNIRIHTVGIGKGGIVPIPTRTVFGTKLINIEVPYDETTLKEVAKITGGNYFNASSYEGLQDVYKQIDKLETREDSSPFFNFFDEKFQTFAIIAFVLMLIKSVLRSTWLFKLP